jgi:hypothetical protein
VKSSEFVREVDEAVRRDRWLGLWKQYGPYVIGGALAVVVGTAAGVGWREYQASERREDARRFAAAVELTQAGRPAEAAGAFAELAEDTDRGYAVLARLRAAEALDRADDPSAKLSTLQSLADNGNVDATYRELARLLAVQERLDDADPDDIATRLAEFTEAEHAWRYTALELQALAQMRAGETAAARETLTRLVNDPSTPANLSQRASELLSALGGPVDGAEDAGAGSASDQ